MLVQHCTGFYTIISKNGKYIVKLHRKNLQFEELKNNFYMGFPTIF